MSLGLTRCAAEPPEDLWRRASRNASLTGTTYLWPSSDTKTSESFSTPTTVSVVIVCAPSLFPVTLAWHAVDPDFRIFLGVASRYVGASGYSVARLWATVCGLPGLSGKLSPSFPTTPALRE